MNDIASCSNAACPDPALRWVCFFLLSWTIFWGIMLYILSRGFLGPATPEHPNGKRFSIFTLQFPFSHSRFRRFLEGLPAKALKPVQWSLKVDFVFMAFAYPFLACSCWYFLRNTSPAAASPGCNMFCWGVGISLLAWVLDVLENILLLSCLKKLSAVKTRTVLLVSSLKWISVLFVAGLLVIALFTMSLLVI